MDKFTGKDLKALREEHRLTQEELAAQLGVHRKTIGNWEADPDVLIRETITFKLDFLFPDEPSLDGRGLGIKTLIDFSSPRAHAHSAIEDKLLTLREQDPDNYGDAYAKAKLKNFYNFQKSALLFWIDPSEQERQAIKNEDQGLIMKLHFDENSGYNERLKLVYQIIQTLGYTYEYGMLHYGVDCTQPHTEEDIAALKAVGQSAHG